MESCSTKHHWCMYLSLKVLFLKWKRNILTYTSNGHVSQRNLLRYDVNKIHVLPKASCTEVIRVRNVLLWMIWTTVYVIMRITSNSFWLSDVESYLLKHCSLLQALVTRSHCTHHTCKQRPTAGSSSVITVSFVLC